MTGRPTDARLADAFVRCERIVRERAKKREEEREKRKKENPRKTFRLTARQSVRGMHLSPDESFVTAIVSERPEGGKRTSVPNYATESAYTAELSARAKVGDTQARSRVLFLDVKTGESKWLDAGQIGRAHV